MDSEGGDKTTYSAHYRKQKESGDFVEITVKSNNPLKAIQGETANFKKSSDQLTIMESLEAKEKEAEETE